MDRIHRKGSRYRLLANGDVMQIDMKRRSAFDDACFAGLNGGHSIAMNHPNGRDLLTIGFGFGIDGKPAINVLVTSGHRMAASLRQDKADIRGLAGRGSCLGSLEMICEGLPARHAGTQLIRQAMAKEWLDMSAFALEHSK